MSAVEGLAPFRGLVREWIAFDLETTGLMAESDRVVEIGAVRFDQDGNPLAHFERLVYPDRPMSASAQAIHGISDAMLAGASPARRVLPDFLDFLGDPTTTVLLAHHAVFDSRFLGHELDRAGLSIPAHLVIDTLSLARRKLPDWPDHRLSSLSRGLDLGEESNHRALGDSLLVQRLWLALNGSAEPADSLLAYPIFDPSSSSEQTREGVPVGWDVLKLAMKQGASIRMEYSGGSRGNAPRNVTPRRFVHRGGVAYFVALCHQDRFEKSFRLDRVVRYEVLAASVSSIGL